MPLDSYLVSKLGVPDILSARALIRDGFAQVNGQAITSQNFPISTQDSVRLTDMRLAQKPGGYFQARELQKEEGLFDVMKDAVCIGANEGTLLFLRERGVEVSNAGLKKCGIKGISEIMLNPLAETISRKHEGKFDYIVMGPGFGLFTVFGILENNKDSLVPKGNALLDVREKDTLCAESTIRLAEGAGFAVKKTIKFDSLDPANGWIILEKKSKE